MEKVENCIYALYKKFIPLKDHKSIIYQPVTNCKYFCSLNFKFVIFYYSSNRHFSCENLIEGYKHKNVPPRNLASPRKARGWAKTTPPPPLTIKPRRHCLGSCGRPAKSRHRRRNCWASWLTDIYVIGKETRLDILRDIKIKFDFEQRSRF